MTELQKLKIKVWYKMYRDVLFTFTVIIVVGFIGYYLGGR